MPIFAKKQISGMILNTNVKLNLGLNVLRKRPDGYHDIETLFVPYLEMGDILEVITGDDYSRTSAALFGKYGRPSRKTSTCLRSRYSWKRRFRSGPGWEAVRPMPHSP